MLALTVAGAVLLSGCLSAVPTAKDISSGSDVVRKAHRTHEVVLRSLPASEGAHHTAFRIEATGNQTIRSRLKGTIALQSPALDDPGNHTTITSACVWSGLGQAEFANFFRPAEVGASAQAVGTGISARYGRPGGQTQNFTVTAQAASLAPGETIYAVAAVASPRGARLDSEQVSYRIWSDRPFYWSKVPVRDVSCLTSTDDFQGGTSVRTDIVKVGQNLVHRQEVQGSGRGVFHLASDLAFEASIEGPNGTYWTAKSAASLGYDNATKFLRLGSGDWRVEVDEIRGTGRSRTGLVLVDIG